MNANLLKSTIKGNGMTYQSVAKELGITYISFNNKTKGKYAFTLDEALKLKKMLNMSQETWDEIFVM